MYALFPFAFWAIINNQSPPFVGIQIFLLQGLFLDMVDKHEGPKSFELERLTQDIENHDNAARSAPEYRPPANDFRHAPQIRGRGLRRVLLVSIAANALLVMVVAWQYLKITSLTMICGKATDTKTIAS